MEKAELMGLIFSDADFALMRRVHDAFNPVANLNPGKIFPLGKGCGEIRVRTTVPHGETHEVAGTEPPGAEQIKTEPTVAPR